jgi:hypothetical protein
VDRDLVGDLGIKDRSTVDSILSAVEQLKTSSDTADHRLIPSAAVSTTLKTINPGFSVADTNRAKVASLNEAASAILAFGGLCPYCKKAMENPGFGCPCQKEKARVRVLEAAISSVGASPALTEAPSASAGAITSAAASSAVSVSADSAVSAPIWRTVVEAAIAATALTVSREKRTKPAKCSESERTEKKCRVCRVLQSGNPAPADCPPAVTDESDADIFRCSNHRNRTNTEMVDLKGLPNVYLMHEKSGDLNGGGGQGKEAGFWSVKTHR